MTAPRTELAVAVDARHRLEAKGYALEKDLTLPGHG
jgi:hypothetical protein